MFSKLGYTVVPSQNGNNQRMRVPATHKKCHKIKVNQGTTLKIDMLFPKTISFLEMLIVCSENVAIGNVAIGKII